MTDFIKEIPAILTKEQCDVLIQDYEVLKSQGLMWRTDHPNQKINDERLEYSTALLSNMAGTCRASILNPISIHVKEYINSYAEGIFSPKTVVNLALEDILIQKTEPTKGYHIWHCERQRLSSSMRVVSWILYLNDVEEGGETEFLYYSKRVKAETGKLVIFPANFTHTHRGNPPLTNDKYIVTGWHRYES